MPLSNQKTKEELVAEIQRLREKVDELTKTAKRAHATDNTIEFGLPSTIVCESIPFEGEEESARKLRWYYENMPDAIIVVDRNAKIIDVNPAASEITRYSEDELLSMTVPDLIPEEGVSTALHQVKTVLEEGESSGEFPFQRKDGTKGIFNLRAVRVSEEYLLGFLRDVTKQKQAEEQLLVSEERFRGLFNNMSSGVAVYEAIADGKDFIFKDFNCSGERIESVRRDDVIGKRVTEVFPGIGEFGLLDVFARVWKTGKLEYHPISFYQDDVLAGWRENYVMKLQSGEIVAVYDDVTEKKQAELRLKESEERFRRIAENAKDMIYRMSVPEGVYEYVSPASSEIFGYAPEEWYKNDKLIERIIHPAWKNYYETQWENLLRGEVPPSSEYQIIHASGHVRWINQRNVLVRGDNGKPIAIEGIVTDVTERKQAEQEREMLINELKAKNAELERFTYTVSHDLKSPLITIRGFVGMIKKALAAGNYEGIEEDFERIGNAADKMHSLLDDVLKLSRIGRIVHIGEEVSLKELTEEVVEMLDSRIKERSIEVRIADDLPSVFGDRTRLYEVMQNLIENAIKFIGNPPHPMIEIGVIYEYGEQICFVRDNGIGIDPKYHDKVFDLFDQLNLNNEGTGVGLALVKRIIETHSGRIWIESNGSGDGTTFYFVIPPSKKES